MVNSTLVSGKRAKPKAKPRGKPFTGPDDPRRGKGGRQPNEKSIAFWLQKFAGMTGVELAELCAIYARELRRAGDELPLAALVAIRVLMSLINDPDARLLGQALDRIDGKVVQPVAEMPWREYAKQMGYDPDALMHEAEEIVSQRFAELGGTTDSRGSNRAQEQRTDTVAK